MGDNSFNGRAILVAVRSLSESKPNSSNQTTRATTELLQF